ncbi:MAG: ABC transporter permease [Planctomycetota bacterium]
MSVFGMEPGKVARVAVREFASTALTKGFIIGVFVFPAILVVVMPLVISLINSSKAPPVRGTLAIVDRSGVVAEDVGKQLLFAAAEAEEEAAQEAAEGDEAAPTAPAPSGGMADLQSQLAAGQDLGAVQRAALDRYTSTPIIITEVRDTNADIEEIQKEIRAEQAEEGGDEIDRLVGVLVVDSDAVVKGSDGYGSYQLFTRPKLDARVSGDIEDAARDAIRERRYAAAGFNANDLRELTTIEKRKTEEITETGTRESNAEFQMILAAAPMFLILIAVATGGQYLLTTTIEEKSSRVVEVLLSAVSATELMTGKILGQMLVGLTLAAIYGGLGVAGMFFIPFLAGVSFAPSVLVLFPICFVLAYMMIASLMAAAGSAVNELREAQSFMVPIMMLLMLPYFLAFPISLNPNAVYSVVLSMVPPVSPFVILIRAASTDPPPVWQMAASVVASGIGALVCLWFAGKVFRVGLLMFGKPPNLGTLIKWVRMA